MRIRALSVFEHVVYHCWVVDPTDPERPKLEVDALLREGDADNGPLLLSVADYITMVGGLDNARACLDRFRSDGRIVDHLGVAHLSFPLWTPVAEEGAVFPFVDAGFSKAMVRAASRALGLRTWDKPAAACLASRLPYGTEVSVEVLSRVERAEAALHALGFRELRVRHYDDTARIEVRLDQLSEVVDRRVAVVEAVLAIGYRYVTLDLEGLRSGNLNQALDLDQVPAD